MSKAKAAKEALILIDEEIDDLLVKLFGENMEQMTALGLKLTLEEVGTVCYPCPTIADIDREFKKLPKIGVGDDFDESQYTEVNNFRTEGDWVACDVQAERHIAPEILHEIKLVAIKIAIGQYLQSFAQDALSPQCELDH